MAFPTSVNSQITDALDPDALPASRACVGFGFVVEGARLSLAWDALEQAAEIAIELPVELDVPVCTPGGIIVPIAARRSFELDAELAKALAAWMRATIPACETKDDPEAAAAKDADTPSPKLGVRSYSLSDGCVEVGFDHDRVTGQLRCHVVLDDIPAELPLPNPWSPCKVALTIRHSVPFPALASACALADWLDAELG